MPASSWQPTRKAAYVSRLSPPLKWQPTLGMVIAKLKTDSEREKAVRNYAETQARELDRLGITMNFGPVVDLRLGVAQQRWRNAHLLARHRQRSLSRRQGRGLVLRYADEVQHHLHAEAFPGSRPGGARHARRVRRTQTANESQLELSDWLPFRRVMTEPGIATMVGHVRIDAVDNDDARIVLRHSRQ